LTTESHTNCRCDRLIRCPGCGMYRHKENGVWFCNNPGCDFDETLALKERATCPLCAYHHTEHLALLNHATDEELASLAKAAEARTVIADELLHTNRLTKPEMLKLAEHAEIYGDQYDAIIAQLRKRKATSKDTL